MSFEYFHIVDAGRARSNNEDSVEVDGRQRVGRAGRRHGWLQRRRSGQRRWPPPSSRPSSGAGCTKPSAMPRDTEVRRAMDICVDNANRAIFNAANSNPQYAGMGTTAGRRPCSASRGCCSATWATRAPTAARAGRLSQITRDHSLLQEQIDAGLITAEQAAFSANKNLVTRAVGVEDTVLLETHLHDVHAGRCLPAVLGRPVRHARRRQPSHSCCRRHESTRMQRTGADRRGQ